MAQPVSGLITTLSRRMGLDPAAVIAVARGEGGLVNRPGTQDIGDLAGGGSYGPFQMYARGALPQRYRGNQAAADAWAWSPAGIQYALSQIQKVAKGKRGGDAVRNIITRFERPAKPGASIQAALARLGSSGVPSAGTRSALPGNPGADALAPSLQANSTGSSQFGQPLSPIVDAILNDGDMLAALSQMPSGGAVSPSKPLGGTSAPPRASRPSAKPKQGTAGKPVTGMDASFKTRLNAMIKASGGRLTINSGFRSVEEQRRLWNAAVKKYGSESAARKWVAPPGKSNHGKGIAADLGGDLDWAHANAGKYGLWFPMSWEKWHIEPKGSRG